MALFLERVLPVVPLYQIDRLVALFGFYNPRSSVLLTIIPMAEDFNNWAKNLDTNALNIWREAMAQLRRMSDDVWNGLRFFLSFNGILIAAAVAVFRIKNLDWTAANILAFLSFCGLGITFLARRVLVKHRDNYSKMLMKKTIIEDELGFYHRKLPGLAKIDLCFPWRVEPQYLPQMKDDPLQWLEDFRRGRNTVTRHLFLVYETLILLYFVALVLITVGFLRGWFSK